MRTKLRLLWKEREDSHACTVLLFYKKHKLKFYFTNKTLIFQIHLLWRYKKFRKLGTLGCTVFVLILCGFLLDVREGWLCILYIIVSVLLCLATYSRPFEKKLPRFYI